MGRILAERLVLIVEDEPLIAMALFRTDVAVYATAAMR